MTSDEPIADAVLHAMTEAVYVVDTHRTITLWNPAAERLTGFTGPEVVGRSCGDGILNHVDEAGQPLCATRCPLLDTMSDGQPRNIRLFLHHRDGQRVPVEISAAALRDPDGAVVGAVEVFHQDGLREMEQRLDDAESAALLDALTGIGNRRLLERALGRHESEHRRHGVRYAVLFIDVDHFKAVNDRFGHDAGDRMLRLIARTLEGCVRPSDTVGRWGGEEFLVLAAVTRPDEAMVLAERIRLVTSSAWLDVDGGPLRITLSVGVGLAADGDASADVVKRADAALRIAKATGRNRTCLSDSGSAAAASG